jgi:hypothetical protein
MSVLWACTDYGPSSVASCREMYPSVYSSLTHLLIILQDARFNYQDSTVKVPVCTRQNCHILFVRLRLYLVLPKRMVNNGRRIPGHCLNPVLTKANWMENRQQAC